MSNIAITDLSAENESKWFTQFEQIKGGTIAKCLVLIALLKREKLISISEGRSFKDFVMRNERKSVLALNKFGDSKSFYQFRNEMRGLLGLPRTRNFDKPKGLNVEQGSSLFETNSTSKSSIHSTSKCVPNLRMQENSIQRRRGSK